MRTFSPNIVKQLLGGRGWNGNDLRDEIIRAHPDNKISSQAVGYWLSGEVSPSAKYLAILGDIFNISIDDMFDSESKTEKPRHMRTKREANAKRKHSRDRKGEHNGKGEHHNG